MDGALQEAAATDFSSLGVFFPGLHIPTQKHSSVLGFEKNSSHSV